MFDFLQTWNLKIPCLKRKLIFFKPSIFGPQAFILRGVHGDSNPLLLGIWNKQKKRLETLLEYMVRLDGGTAFTKIKVGNTATRWLFHHFQSIFYHHPNLDGKLIPQLSITLLPKYPNISWSSMSSCSEFRWSSCYSPWSFPKTR